MTRLQPTDYLAHLRTESARFRTVLAGCDPAARVPACPDWDAADLLWHLAQVQLFWATVLQRRPAPPDGDATRAPRPTTYDGLLAAFDDHSGMLLTELGAADPAEPAWSWASEQSVAFSYRRQAHEALIHRLDAEQAAGQVTPLDPALAADGVAELLEVMYGGLPAPGSRFESADGLVTIALGDVGVRLWARPGRLHVTHPETGTTRTGPHVLLVSEPDGPDDPGGPDGPVAAEARITGAAAEVDAWLWRRRDATAITRSGDRAVLDAFAAAVDFPLG